MQNQFRNSSKSLFRQAKIKVPTSAALALCLGLGFSLNSPKATAAPEAPLVAEAYKQAKSPLLGKAVYATITLTLTENRPSQPSVLMATGKVRIEGDLLEGTLPLTFSESNKVASGLHQLRFNVNPQGRIGLQWLTDNQPRLGAAMKAFNMQATSDALTGKVNWNGANRLATVSFSYGSSPRVAKPIKLVNGTVIARPITIKPTPTPKPEKKLEKIKIIKLKQKPVGRRVKLQARFVVTNSDDGVGGIWGSKDMELEMSGFIRFGDQLAFDFSKRDAREGSSFDSRAMKSVELRYNDPEHKFFLISGRIYDEDKASNSDQLWVANQKINLLEILNSNKEFVIRGDRDSESGDLYIRVIDEGEFR